MSVLILQAFESFRTSRGGPPSAPPGPEAALMPDPGPGEVPAAAAAPLPALPEVIEPPPPQAPIPVPKYWSFSFSIGPSNEYSRLISFRIGWFDLLAVQGT